MKSSRGSTSPSDNQGAVVPWASSKAKLKLIALFRTGKIKPETPPLAIWHSDPIFQHYNINNFRNNFSRLKKKELKLKETPATTRKKEVKEEKFVRDELKSDHISGEPRGLIPQENSEFEDESSDSDFDPYHNLDTPSSAHFSEPRSFESEESFEGKIL